MSWSFNATGKPDKVLEKLTKDLGNYGAGQSRDEFAAAAPHLTALIESNFAQAPQECLVQVEASGSGSMVDGKMVSSSCTVSIKQIYGVLL
jgi:hypothetical protein